MSFKFQTSSPSLRKHVQRFLNDWNAPSPTLSVSTSGSTGVPKEIHIAKEAMRASALATGKALGLRKGDRALLCISPDTIGGKMMLVRSIELGLDLTVVSPSSTPLSGLVRSDFDFVAMVPLQLEKTLLLQPEQLDQLRKIIIGGAPMHEALLNAVQKVHPEIYQTYGMTETISHVALRPVNCPKSSYYTALEGIQFSQGPQGQLIIDAPHIGVHQLETNDIVELKSTQQFRWKGRLDFVINSGGIKVHPEMVEQLLSSCIRVPFFISGIPDKTLGQKVILVLESTENIHLSKPEITDVLPAYHAPREVYFLPAFSYTKSGKINRIETLKHLENASRKVL